VLRRFLPRAVWVALVPPLAAAAVALLDTRSGVPAVRRLGEDLARAQTRMAALREEIAEAEALAAALAEDRFAIERAVREELGLARPGETVLRLARPGERALRLAPRDETALRPRGHADASARFR
jgi:cell division protein FtsB